MKLKYHLIVLSLLGGMATACDPMDDIYTEIDAQGDSNVQTLEGYVLTDADYESISKTASKAAQTPDEKALAKAVAADKALNSFATAEKFVPGVIASMVPSWTQGSSVSVTYNYQNDPSELVMQARTVTASALKSEDYEALWGVDSPIKFLSPRFAPATVLPNWLAAHHKDAEKGDRVLVEYKYDTKDPVFSGEDIFVEDFENLTEEKKPVNLEGWKQVLLKGERSWEGRTYNNNWYAQLSANNYGQRAVDAWMITPAVEITSEDISFSFDVKFRFYNADCLDILVSDTYQGDGQIKLEDWKSLKDAFELPKTDMDNFVNAGKCSLAAYKGKKVFIAFRYEGVGPKEKTTTVQIDNVNFSSVVLSPTNEKPYSDLYYYNGSKWTLNSDSRFVAVAPADYDAMGNPGKHDNFSESDAPANYLPQFLAVKFPFAQEGDVKAVIYKYFADKKTTMRADEYVFTQGAWLLNNNLEKRENVNFVNSKDGWVFDPTVTKSLTSDDFLILENWVKANKDAGYMDAKYGNSEYWFGGSSYYVNFNVQLSKRRSNDPDKVVPADDKEAEAYLLKMVKEGIELILATQYPDAEAQVSGIDCYYIISAKVYNGLETLTYTYKFKGLGAGKFDLTAAPDITK